jgi:hypothetical protein
MQLVWLLVLGPDLAGPATQAAVRAIPADTTDPAAAAQRAELLRRYRRRATSLLRKHKLTHAMEQLRLWRKDSTVFWRNSRLASPSCPIAPGAATAYFKQKMNSFAPASPLAPPTGMPGRQLDATSACPTTEEIVAAIGRMHSTAAGIDGLLQGRRDLTVGVSVWDFE